MAMTYSIRNILNNSKANLPYSLRHDLINRHGDNGGWIKQHVMAVHAETEPWIVVNVNEADDVDKRDVAVHIALFPDGEKGKILMFGGVDLNNEVSGLSSFLYDIASNTIEKIDSPVPDNNTFCAGHTFLADGRLLIAGGQLAQPKGEINHHDDIVPDHDHPGEEDQHDHGNMSGGGDRKCWTFSPTQNWQAAASLNLAPDGQANSGGRWYPTLVTLGDGRVFCAGGHMDVREKYPSSGLIRHNNNTPEIYTPSADTWTLITEETIHENNLEAYDYQRMHVMPNGTVFFSNVVKGKNRFYNVNEQRFVGDAIDPPSESMYRVENGSTATFTSVLFPLLFEDNYKARILLMGSRSAERIDLSDDPRWRRTKAREWPDGDAPARLYIMPVILPTGQVFFCGGTENGRDDQAREENVIMRGEVYTPGINWENGSYDASNESWEFTEPASVPRHYHASALLLPDGSVWTGGSNGSSPNNREHRIEIYRPWYMAIPNRLQIIVAPDSVQAHEVFDITVSEASQVARVGMIRNGSFTHAFNSDQRYISLSFEILPGNTLRIEAPPNCSVAPGGYYMLWIIDIEGRPCQFSHFIHFNG